MMKKSILKLAVWMFALPLLFAACSETDSSVDPYENWDVRNQTYIDSIATVAKANLGDGVGEWKVIRSYKLPPLGLNEVGEVNDNVYCKIVAVGTGDKTPKFTDNVATNYRGKLVNGTVFDQSYKGVYDPTIATPIEFTLSGVITGWTTALQVMKEGDRWEMYIPYSMAYGTSGSGTIPGYSTLYFDVDLRKVIAVAENERSLAAEFEVSE